MKNLITKKEAMAFLSIDEGCFKNYQEKSKEIIGFKHKNRWYFDLDQLKKFKSQKYDRTINLSNVEYEACFEFAIRMVYGGLSLNGIRGQRSEVQAADDVILGILAEHAIKKFLYEKYNTLIALDDEVHTSKITPQDIHKVIDGKNERDPKIGVGIKASKMKSAYLVLGGNEVEHNDRASDYYIFARVGLPTDHLFRTLRDHSFFANAKSKIENDSKSRKIEKLENIPVWICGYTSRQELEKVTSIPGQEFSNGYRYVKSVAKLHNTDKDWKKFITKL